jgi:cytochrome b561
MADAAGAWTRNQRVLHWTIAVLVGIAACMGIIMVGLPFRELLLKFVLYQVHKSLGIAVLLLAVAQLVLHLTRGRPAWSDRLPERQRRAAFAVHVGLFALLVAVPCLGYLTAATAPARIPTLFLGVIPVPHIVGVDAALFAVLRRVHLAFAVTLLVIACGHAAMAIWHHWHGDDTLRRMWTGRPRHSAAADAASR